MLFNARNGTFDSCTLTSGSELWLFLLSVDVTTRLVCSVSCFLDGACVCEEIRKNKSVNVNRHSTSTAYARRKFYTTAHHYAITAEQINYGQRQKFRRTSRMDGLRMARRILERRDV